MHACTRVPPRPFAGPAWRQDCARAARRVVSASPEKKRGAPAETAHPAKHVVRLSEPRTEPAYGRGMRLLDACRTPTSPRACTRPHTVGVPSSGGHTYSKGRFTHTRFFVFCCVVRCLITDGRPPPPAHAAPLPPTVSCAGQCGPPCSSAGGGAGGTGGGGARTGGKGGRASFIMLCTPAQPHKSNKHTSTQERHVTVSHPWRTRACSVAARIDVLDRRTWLRALHLRTVRR